MPLRDSEDQSENEIGDQTEKPNGKFSASKLANVIAVASAAKSAFPLIPWPVGFTKGGVAAGSIAAGVQSAIGNVAGGSLFSLCQSAAAVGMGAPAFLMLTASGACLVYNNFDHIRPIPGHIATKYQSSISALKELAKPLQDRIKPDQDQIPHSDEKLASNEPAGSPFPRCQAAVAVGLEASAFIIFTATGAYLVYYNFDHIRPIPGHISSLKELVEWLQLQDGIMRNQDQISHSDEKLASSEPENRSPVILCSKL